MRYYIIAGEASGDLHGSMLIRGIKQHDAEAEIRFWGGDLMAAEAGAPVKHYRELAFMGFLEVLLNMRTVLGNIRFCKRDIAAWNPDVVILIDYPGFNFRIAEFAHNAGFKVFYYIAPKVWAWKEGRVKRIQQNVDKLFIIFPFETEYFKRFGIDAFYAGNPLVDSVAQKLQLVPSKDQFSSEHGLDERPIITLLAGSRKQEIAYCLPTMAKLAAEFPDYQVVVAGAPSLTPDDYQPILEGTDVKVVFGKTYELLAFARAAAVVSGTATLEAALIGTPQVVCYRGSAISIAIARRFVKVKYISLVNLIMDREVVKELIQKDFTLDSVAAELRLLLQDGPTRDAMLASYASLCSMLGEPAVANRVAAQMVKELKSRIS
ncbi:MAG TPA: lipid-A-disaccharide synthase [Williamwhitmania sp.]|nr:lipid-A-disaccharide synthase [Williamwhitmania sp.]